MEKEVSIIHINSTTYQQEAGEILNRYNITGVPAVLVIENGEVLEYLYDSKWTSKGLADDNMVINYDVIREFIDVVGQ